MNEYVKPSRDDVIAALGQRCWEINTGDVEPWGELTSEEWANVIENESLEPLADAVLALLPGRTEAEVKAEALREAAEEAGRDYLGPGRLIAPDDLITRANELDPHA